MAPHGSTGPINTAQVIKRLRTLGKSYPRWRVLRNDVVLRVKAGMKSTRIDVRLREGDIVQQVEEIFEIKLLEPLVTIERLKICHEGYVGRAVYLATGWGSG